ncbi:MAG TPA: tail fiber assembly protein [Enterobacteriaceae bacterium]|nr:tail fiber assembly protein [Enterobacteriaceae bacterium]
MKNYEKFSQYTPKNNDAGELGQKILYMRDALGNDWYEAVKSFSADTLKIAYNDEGRVFAVSADASRIIPLDMSVVELPATKANQLVAPGDDWFYKDGKLQQIRDYVAIAAAERDSRMTAATVRIDRLAAAQEDGDASASEEAELTALRAYRTALRRLDLTTAPDIEWPKAPVV